MSIRDISCRADDTRPVVVRELGTIDYQAAWDVQRELAHDRAEDTGGDTLLLLEHPSVYTAGKRTTDDERPDDGTPVIDVDRGGKITWHGPGQLVGYPIVKLSDPVDVVQYVRRVEEALIEVCARLGLATGRVEGRSGVWLAADETRPERKIAAIGIRVQRGVTLHGFEINCDADLSAFDRIIPCGIRDAGVTSLTAELGRRVTVAEVLPLAREAVLAALAGTLPVSEHPLAEPEPATPGVTFALS
ncbi:lipoyl(octanoyl) transferase LipB [Actinokineospora sp. NBRC 105648]|uniref:lipoyl(octanoyl) transferase LipB n=1 Tax=Actinokineospora sp. NBRC 105648 TaxID=3032206 RepID=UPI0024A1D76C|nr:lipoyl(octanoyl) transferase LipB [Actinokineospora sp. NBRC 105648]GLZ42678.1 octanoyltransferase [Actinokineospora sp. NBRC 105648]